MRTNNQAESTTRQLLATQASVTGKTLTPARQV
jgi:hypothetical protein